MNLPSAQPASKRRWLRYGLWTLAVSVPLLGIWLGVHASWKNDRAKVLRWLDQFQPAAGERPMYYLSEDIRTKPAPLSLLALGDRTVRIVHIPFDDEPSIELADVRVREAKRLFPEADVSLLHRSGPSLAGNAGALWEPIEQPPATH